MRNSNARTHNSVLSVTAHGIIDSIAELGEQLAWLGAFLRPSTFGGELAFSRPSVETIRPARTQESRGNDTGKATSYTCILTSRVGLQKPLNNRSSDGQCWHGLFRTSSVVEGYPILRRPQHALGLEIPLNIMIALMGSNHIDVFDGKCLIKAFAGVLFPIKATADLLNWHLIFNEDGSEMSWLDKRIQPEASMRDIDFGKIRHIVGWCFRVRYNAGKHVDPERCFAFTADTSCTL